MKYHIWNVVLRQGDVRCKCGELMYPTQGGRFFCDGCGRKIAHNEDRYSSLTVPCDCNYDLCIDCAGKVRFRFFK